jgi:hypothetical protein
VARQLEAQVRLTHRARGLHAPSSSLHPLRVIAEVQDWEPSDPELLKGMLESLEKMREQGLQNLIED